MTVQLTEAAADEIKRIIEDQNHEELKYVRVGVVGGGCSGFQYSFDFTEKYDTKADMFREQHSVGIIVDKKSDLFLDGTTIDFYSGLVYRKLGIPRDLFTPVFAISRVAGWLAHWREQLGANRIFRPSQIYEGAKARNWQPLENR